MVKGLKFKNCTFEIKKLLQPCINKEVSNDNNYYNTN